MNEQQISPIFAVLVFSIVFHTLPLAIHFRLPQADQIVVATRFKFSHDNTMETHPMISSMGASTDILRATS